MSYMVLALLIIISFVYFVFYKVLQEKGKKPTLKNNLLFFGICLAVFLIFHSTILGLFKIPISQVVILNGSSSSKDIILNGETMRFSSRQSSVFGTSSFFNVVKISDPRMKKPDYQYRFGKGTFAIAVGHIKQLEIKERSYKALDNSFSNKDEKMYHNTVSNNILKIDNSANKCFLLQPGRKFPKYVTPKLKGKRLLQCKVI